MVPLLQGIPHIPLEPQSLAHKWLLYGQMACTYNQAPLHDVTILTLTRTLTLTLTLT